MTILQTSGWQDYELLDSGAGRRLERFGGYVLDRPDPQAIWLPSTQNWQADAAFGDTWQIKNHIPEKWLMHHKDLAFWARLTPFKHTGIFAEQVVHWDWLVNKLQTPNPKSPLKILNLFGYTGIASLAATKAGARVTHVDASKPAITWARENMLASGLPEDAIRWIVDDVAAFVEREIRRGNKYDGIIMDPPIYGKGPKGETWDFQHNFSKLMADCKSLLSDDARLLVVNAYAISASALMLKNVLQDYLDGEIEYGELALVEKSAGRLLSTGIFARWSR